MGNNEIEDLFDKFDNGTATDEEINQLMDEIFNEIKNGELIGGYEISFLNEFMHPYDEKFAGVGRHGWVIYNQYWRIDDNFYKCTRYYHDDQGSEYDDQIFVKCKKKVIETEIWEETE